MNAQIAWKYFFQKKTGKKQRKEGIKKKKKQQMHATTLQVQRELGLCCCPLGFGSLPVAQHLQMSHVKTQLSLDK